MKRGKLIFSLVFFVVFVSLASAGLGDWLKATGKAPSGEQNVTVSVVGVHILNVTYVQSGFTADPTENSTTFVIFQAHVYDEDGVGNLDHNSVNAVFTKIGEATRTGNCVHENNIDGYTANYTCNVTMWFYDAAVTDWSINVSALDQESNYAENISETFIYSELKSFDVPLSPATLNWAGLAPGSSNQEADNDPTNVTNLGNFDGNIHITAYDLVGQTTPSENISATAFDVSETSGSECSAGSTLGPDDQRADTNIDSSRGATGFNTAYIYYCLTQVPPVSSQIYSTAERGQSWVVEYYP
jgi:hypothetical protein